MIKDPNDKQPTPYELLGLPLDAPLALVRGALAKFMMGEGRRQRQLIPAAQQAVRKLQNARERAEVDVMLYGGALPEVPVDAVEAVLQVDDLVQPVTVDPAELYSDLQAEPGRADEREIKYRKVAFSDVRSFDGIESVTIQPQFDR